MKHVMLIAAPVTMVLTATHSTAQSLAPMDPIPPVATVDENFVDMTAGQFRIPIKLLSNGISPNAQPITISITGAGGEFKAGAIFSAQAGPQLAAGLSTNYGAEREAYPFGRVIMPDSNGDVPLYAWNGSYLLAPPKAQSDGSYIYLPEFLERGQDSPLAIIPREGNGNSAAVQLFSMSGTRMVVSAASRTIIFSDGERWDLYLNSATFRGGPADPSSAYPIYPSATVHRLKFLISSRGFGVQFSYLRDNLSGTNSYNEREWAAPVRITLFNRSKVFCDPATLTDCASLSGLKTVATIEYDNGSGTVTFRSPENTSGVKVTYSQGSTTVADLSISGSTKTYARGESTVSNYSGPNGKFKYSFSQQFQEGDNCPCDGMTIASRDDPLGGSTSSTGDVYYTMPGQIGDAAGLISRYEWLRGRPVGVVRESVTGSVFSSVGFKADNRGNVTEQTLTATDGSAPITLFRSTFPVECLNPKTCNKPTSITDGNGYTTTYTYSPEHGGVLTKSSPAVNGVSPVVRYAYAQRYAWITNGSGAFVHAGDPIWVLVSEKTCRTTSTNIAGDSCAGGAADEVVTTYDYGPDDGRAGNNLLMRGKTILADGQAIRTCFGYDDDGNKIWETSPRAGLLACY